MAKRADLSINLVLGAALTMAIPGVALAQESWTVTTTETHPVHIQHIVAPATLSFYAEHDAEDDEYDLNVHIKVDSCGGEDGVSIELVNGVTPYEESVEGRAIKVREYFESAVKDAASSCDLPADFAERALEGFGPAYRQADAMMIEAGILPLPDPFAFFSE